MTEDDEKQKRQDLKHIAVTRVALVGTTATFFPPNPTNHTAIRVMSTPPDEKTGMSCLQVTAGPPLVARDRSGVPGFPDLPHAPLPQSPPHPHCDALVDRTTPPNEAIETPHALVTAVDTSPPIAYSASGVPLLPNSEQQRQQHNRLRQLGVGYKEQRHEREQREQDVADRTRPDKMVRQEGDDESRVPLVTAVNKYALPAAVRFCTIAR